MRDIEEEQFQVSHSDSESESCHFKGTRPRYQHPSLPMATRWLLSLMLTAFYSLALGSQHVFTADPTSVSSIKNNGVVRRFDITESTLQQVLITAEVRLLCSSLVHGRDKVCVGA